MVSCTQIGRHRERAETKSTHLTATGRFVFSATVSASMHGAVETLFFFNPRQSLLHSAIAETVHRTGVPEIFECDGTVWIGVPKRAMQCLFVCTRPQTACRPVGVALYERPVFDLLSILHLAVHPVRRIGLGFLLVKKIMEIAHCIKGVTRVQVPYRDECCLPVRLA
jgi:hypothetical protein